MSAGIRMHAHDGALYMHVPDFLETLNERAQQMHEADDHGSEKPIRELAAMLGKAQEELIGQAEAS